MRVRPRSWGTYVPIGSLLGRPLSLHDVRDVERLCASVLHRSGLDLPHHEREDVLAFLIAEAWRLSENYDPRKDRAAAKGRAPSFASYAEHSLRRRLVDFQRSRYRTRWVGKDYVYERPRPQFVNVDDAEPELERALESRTGDREAGRSADLDRILAGGSRQRARDLELLGLGEDERAA